MTYDVRIKDLLGKTLTEVSVNSYEDVITFVCDNGEQFRLYHEQNCCEYVSIEDIAGDLADLVGSPILVAEESTNSEEHPDGWSQEYEGASFTWTFYKIDTAKGGVTIRWYGSSNGYYSESVNFERTSEARYV